MLNASKSRLDVFLTGVTGMVGRSVFYELLKLYSQGKYEGKIFLLIRDKSESVYSRLSRLFEQGSLPDYLKDIATEKLLAFAECIGGDILDPDLKDKINKKISKLDKIHVIHSAASTNLFSTEEADKSSFENNCLGTLRLLEAFEGYHFKFSFISTIASYGVWQGIIPNDYLKLGKNEFRNPYEKYKAMSEKAIYDYCVSRGIEYQILRPSTICGRLLDAPLYFTSKFDVFYGCAKFFHSLKQWNLPRDKVRIQINREAGLNIVPVDYVAKVIVKTIPLDVQELNIVHSESISHIEYLPQMLETVGYPYYELVDEFPTSLNKTESLYYGLIGKVYSPYVTGPKCSFDSKLLREIMIDVVEPNMKSSMVNLVAYAVEEWSKKLLSKGRKGDA